MNDYYQSHPSYFSLTSEVREKERERDAVGERRLRRSFMYFKDWDSQRAAESEVRWGGRGGKGKLHGKRRSCLHKSNFGNLKERVTEGLDLKRLWFSEWSRTTTASEKETSTESPSVASGDPEGLWMTPWLSVWTAANVDVRSAWVSS